MMLANVLNSDKAIEVNIQIIRIFTKLREMVLTHKDILLKLEQLEREAGQNSIDIQSIFAVLKQLINPPPVKRPPIGFKLANKKKTKSKKVYSSGNQETARRNSKK